MPPPFGIGTSQIQAGSGISSSSHPAVSGSGSILSSANSASLGPAAAAAAAVLEAATSGSRYSGAAQTTGQTYLGSQEMMLSSKANENTALSSAHAPNVPPSGMPSLQLGSMIGDVQTGNFIDFVLGIQNVAETTAVVYSCYLTRLMSVLGTFVML